MKTIAAGEFKQKCLRLLDQVQQTGTPLTVTKRGRPVARLVPVSGREAGDWRGVMAGTGEILGDIVAPAAEPDEWDAHRAPRKRKR